MTLEREAIIARVRALVEPIAGRGGFELVDVELVGGRGRSILRVLIDKPGRVTLDDCVHVNRTLSDLLDVEDPIPYPYTLEVCSPGLDRPFKTVRDYERAYGQCVKIITRVPVAGTTVHIGRLERCVQDTVTLTIKEVQRDIPLDVVQKAQRELVWE
jgi:ribosome maturation factor RimP